MNSVTKKMRLALAALALATAPVSLALAESNHDPSGLEGSNLVVSNPVQTQTGSNAYPTFSPGEAAVVSNPVQTQTGSSAYPTFSSNEIVGVRTGAVVALAGAQSEPQPVNAIPNSLTGNDARLFARANNQ